MIGEDFRRIWIKIMIEKPKIVQLDQLFSSTRWT